MADTGVVSSRLWRYPRAMDMPSVLKRRAQRIRQLEAANAQLLARIRHLEAQLANAGADPWEQIKRLSFACATSCSSSAGIRGWCRQPQVGYVATSSDMR